MAIRRTEADYDLIREGFIDGFVNAYNLTVTELGKLQSSEVNAALEKAFNSAPVREKARVQAEKHISLLKLSPKPSKEPKR